MDPIHVIQGIGSHSRRSMARSKNSTLPLGGVSAVALLMCLGLYPATAALSPCVSRLPHRANVPRRAVAPHCLAPDNTVTDDESLLRQGSAWALMFNYRTENEGIYSQSREDGIEYILTWMIEEDAVRYSEMLSAQDFPDGTAVQMETRMLLDFCKDSGHTLCLVPSDTVLMPPEQNVETFEWSPGESAEGSQPAQEMTEEELRMQQMAFEALLGPDSGDATD